MKSLILFLIFITYIGINAQKAGPKIVSAEMDYKFGDIKEGEIVSHNFKIFNKGDELLKITEVKASCGCTAVNPEKNELEPNESTSIKVDFNSTGRSGIQSKTVYISSNDPQNPQIRLTFSANIIQDKKETKESVERPILKLGTTQHNFGNIKEGDVVEFSIPFQNSGKQALIISEIQESCSCTVTELSSKTILPGKYGTLKIKFDSKDRTGKVSRTVTVISNDTLNPKQTITLFVNIAKKD
ncbi:MAG: DUF1573 domain-containing protein [bacterium]